MMNHHDGAGELMGCSTPLDDNTNQDGGINQSITFTGNPTLFFDTDMKYGATKEANSTSLSHVVKAGDKSHESNNLSNPIPLASIWMEREVIKDQTNYDREAVMTNAYQYNGKEDVNISHKTGGDAGKGNGDGTPLSTHPTNNSHTIQASISDSDTATVSVPNTTFRDALLTQASNNSGQYDSRKYTLRSTTSTANSTLFANKDMKYGVSREGNSTSLSQAVKAGDKSHESNNLSNLISISSASSPSASIRMEREVIKDQTNYGKEAVMANAYQYNGKGDENISHKTGGDAGKGKGDGTPLSTHPTNNPQTILSSISDSDTTTVSVPTTTFRNTLSAQASKNSGQYDSRKYTVRLQCVIPAATAKELRDLSTDLKMGLSSYRGKYVGDYIMHSSDGYHFEALASFDRVGLSFDYKVFFEKPTFFEKLTKWISNSIQESEVFNGSFSFSSRFTSPTAILNVFHFAPPRERCLIAFLRYTSLSTDELIINDFIDSFNNTGKYFPCSECYSSLLKVYGELKSQPSNFPLVAAAFIGRLDQKGNVKEMLSNPSFPSSALLRSIDEQEIDRLEMNIQRLIMSGIGLLNQHNYAFTKDFVWFEKLSIKKFTNETVNQIQSNKRSKYIYGKSDEDLAYIASFNQILLSSFRFNNDNVSIFVQLFQSSPSVECGYGVLDKLLDEISTISNQLMQKILKPFLLTVDMPLLIVLALKLKDKFDNRETNLVQFRQMLRETFINMIVNKISIDDMRLLRFEDINAFYLNQNHIEDCFNRMINYNRIDIAEKALTLVLDTNLTPIISGDSLFPVKACKLWINKMYSKRKSNNGTDIVKAFEIVAQASVLLTSAANVLNYRIDRVKSTCQDIINEIGVSLLRGIPSYSFIQSVSALSQLFARMVHTDDLEECAVNLIRTNLLQFLTTPHSYMQALIVIDGKVSGSLNEFSTIVMNEFFKIFVQTLKKNEYADFAPHSAFIVKIYSRNNEDNISYHVVTSNLQLKQLHKYLTELINSITNQSMTVDTFCYIQSLDSSLSWWQDLMNFSVAIGGTLTQQSLMFLTNSIADLRVELQNIRSYLNLISRYEGLDQIKGCQELVDECTSLEQRFGSLTLKETLGSDIWLTLEDIRAQASFLNSMENSKLFMSEWIKQMTYLISLDEVDTFSSVCKTANELSSEKLNNFLSSLKKPFNLSVNNPVLSMWTSETIFIDEYNALKETKFANYLPILGESKHILENWTNAHKVCYIYAPKLLDVFKLFACILEPNNRLIIELDILSHFFETKEHQTEEKSSEDINNNSDSTDDSLGYLPNNIDILRTSDHRMELNILSRFFETGVLQTEEKSADAINNNSNSTVDSLGNLSQHIDKWRTSVNQLTEGYFESVMDIITELQAATDLVSFLKEIRNEKNFNLIDMVEEHSDSIIRAETVSEFDIIRRFIRPLIEYEDVPATNWLQTLARAAQDEAFGGIGRLPVKINSCRLQSHGIRDMWNSVAKREESTKKTVHKLLENGAITWCRIESSDFFIVVHSNNADGGIDRKDKSSFEELRSRALLLVNSIPKIQSSDRAIEDIERERDELQQFICMADKIIEISQLLSDLILLGHFYCNRPLLEVKFSQNDIEVLFQGIESMKTDWVASLNHLRLQHYHLNFFFSYQFWTLHDYFRGTSNTFSEEVRIKTSDLLKFLGVFDEETISNFSFAGSASMITVTENCRRKALALLHFVSNNHEGRPYESFEGCYNSDHAILEVLAEDDERMWLQALGWTLDGIFNDTSSLRKDIHDNDNYNEDRFLTSYFTYDSDFQLIPMLFAIYPDGNFSRHQILFCEEGISVEEFTMFLMRVFSGRNHKTISTYTIVNVHKLNHNDRASLLRVLTITKCKQHSNNSNNLILLLRSDVERHIEGMKLPRQTNFVARTDSDIQNMVRERAHGVIVVTSAVAGLGKTEYCITEADIQNKRTVSILVTDGESRRSFVESVQDTTIFPHECLHLDVACPIRIADIEIGLFELFYLGTSQIDTTIVHLPAGSLCYIEVASQVKNRNSVDCLRYFRSHEVVWSIESFSVSPDLNSDIQVVCNYLTKLEDGTLYKDDIIFPNEYSREITASYIYSDRCHALLRKYFIAGFAQHEIPSVNVLQVFLKVLAGQLREFSASGHFQTISFQFSGSDPRNRHTIVENLITCSRDFATKSVVHARNRQLQHMYGGGTNNNNEVDELGGILRWEDNNQVMLCISNSSLTLLYRHLDEVNKDIKKWINLQNHESALRDYFDLSTDDLRQLLSNFCGKTERYTGRPKYVLTADNFLKCVMMLLRVQAGIPVIIMGEAGCGKTSLIRFAADVSEADLFVMAIHAGVSRQDIARKLIARIKSQTILKKSLWIFLDEINTCNELGFINSIICQRRIGGFSIPSLVSFFAACNPFKKRKSGEVLDTIGLCSSKLNNSDGLVYRVNPLPQTMLDFIWDFGSLSETDERLYIYQMLNNIKGKFPNKNNILDLYTTLISASQGFIRNIFGMSAVSMRDVRRVTILVQWFEKNKISVMQKGIFYDTVSEDEVYSAMILALAHCYRCRLADKDLLHNYDVIIANCFRQYRMTSITEDWIQERIKREQTSYLQAMNIGIGIALNDALIENVFVLLVCILNRIPVFLVGKPGSSKSLSMTLIASNLRGLDSEHEFFRHLPEVKVISFQGSESSTSDGIIKIFKKAEDFCTAEETNCDNSSGRGRLLKVIPVVLLDEVGLAEISPFNPLKVLHSKLETEDDRPLDVAVVGISNWTLDASKMSRAIQLSRPEPDVEELYKTCRKIVTAIINNNYLPPRMEARFQSLSKAYFDFYTQQKVKNANFHGLRDFYSMNKELGRAVNLKGIMTAQDITNSIRRNFGGLEQSLKIGPFQTFFNLEIDDQVRRGFKQETTVNDLIRANLQDPHSRHLMIITKGDSLLNVVGNLFEDAGIAEYRVMVGSKFKGDASENYRYRMLSEIILSMERGESLALRDLDGIYGSLYDMLNQNYTVIAGKKNCRVALGAYSNPMAHVHDKFKCVVVADFAKKHHQVVDVLEKWVESFCKVQNQQSQSLFTVRDTFIGLSENGSISSLVFALIKTSQETSSAVIINECKRKLLRTASLQGVVRALFSHESITNEDETDVFCESYFNDRSHMCLKSFMEEKFTSDADATSSTSSSSRSIVTTYSSFYYIDSSSINMIPANSSVISEKLSGFDTEKDLSYFVRKFCRVEDEHDFMVLQCDAAEDIDKLLLTKLIIDGELKSYENTKQQNKKKKHVIVILRIRSELYEEDRRAGFDVYFSQEWDNFHIDDLEQDDKSWFSIVDLVRHHKSVISYLKENENIFQKCFELDIMSCFRCIKYITPVESMHIQKLCSAITQKSNGLKCLLRDKIMFSLEKYYVDETENWIFQVACSREHLEFASSSFITAVDSYIRSIIREPFIKCIYLMEKYSALPAYINQDSLSETHINIFMNCPKLDLSVVLPPRGNECYDIPTVYEGLEFPFSMLLIESLDGIKADYLKELQDNTVKDLYGRFQTRINSEMNEFFMSCDANIMNDTSAISYCKDLSILFAAQHSSVKWLNISIEAVHRLLSLLGFEEGVRDPKILQLLLWGKSKLISSAMHVMRSPSNQLMDLCDIDRLQECGKRNKVDVHDNWIKLTIHQLAMDFCSKSLESQSLSSLPIQIPFNMSAFKDWGSRMESRFPQLMSMCREGDLDFFKFDVDDEYCLQNRFLFRELMRYVLGIRLLLDMYQLLLQLDINDTNNTELCDVLSVCFQNISVLDMNTEVFQNVLNCLNTFANILPAQAFLVQAFICKIMDRFQPIAAVDIACGINEDDVDTHNETTTTDTNMNNKLLRNDLYKVICNQICMHAHTPSLASSRIIIRFIEDLFSTLCEVEQSNDEVIALELGPYGCLRNFDTIIALTPMKEVIDSFEALFDHNITSTNLEVMMIDKLYGCLLGDEQVDFEQDGEVLCTTFSTLISNWIGKTFSEISLVERIYGLAFIRWFLDHSKQYLINEEPMLETLSTTLENTIGKQRDHAINDSLCIYLLKALRKPFHELQTTCQEGGILNRQAEWLGNYPWNIDDLNLTNLIPLYSIDNSATRQEIEEAWYEMFYSISHSNHKLKDLMLRDESNNTMISTLIQVAFMKCCRSSLHIPQIQTNENLIALLDLLSDTVNARFRILLESVFSRFPTILPDEFQFDDICLLLLTFSIALSHSGAFKENGIFQIYSTSPAMIARSFVLGAQSSEQAALFKSFGQDFGYYQCPCGFMYVIDACQKPMESTLCPKCNRTLGGIDHVFSDTQQMKINTPQEDQSGYLYPMEYLQVDNYAERLLTPNEYRLQALLVHCCLFIGLITSGNEFVPIFGRDANVNEAARLCWNQMKGHWNVLCRRMASDGRVEQLCAFVIAIIEKLGNDDVDIGSLPLTPEMREESEKKFSIICSNYIDNYEKKVSEAMIRYNENMAIMPLHEKQIKELDDPPHFISRYLRLITIPDFEKMENTYLSSKENMEKYPFIGIFLRHEKMLERVKWMLPLVEWTNAVRKLLNFQISSQDAEVSVEKVLTEKENNQSYEAMSRQVFNAFAIAWNQFYKLTPTVDFNRQIINECKDVNLCEMNEHSSILLSCIRLRNEGCEVPYMLHVLGEYQNKFLREIFQTYHSNKNISNQPMGAIEKRLQDIADSDIIIYDRKTLWDNISPYTRSNLNYGSSGQIECDFANIEQFLLQKFIYDKNFLGTDIMKDGAIQEFRFKHEIFQKDQVNLLHRVNEVIRQEPSVPDIRSIRNDRFVSNQTHVESRLLPAVESILYVLQNQTKRRDLSTQTLMEFVSTYLDHSTHQLFQEYEVNQSPLTQLQLVHIEALYEILEDEISDTILRCIDEKYNTAISANMKEMISTHLLPKVGGLEAFEGCLRRFIIRYLRGQDAINPALTFDLYVKFIRWPKGIDIIKLIEDDDRLKVVFEQLLIGNSYAVWQYVHELIEEKKRQASFATSSTASTSHSSSSISTPSTSSICAVNDKKPSAVAKRTRVKKTDYASL